MPPVVGALLPHPPLLVGELAGAAAPELDPLRAACRQALTVVVEAADLTVVVGDGEVWGVPEPSAPGSFHPYGADVEVALPALVDLALPGLPAPARLTGLPLSLAVAAHLLADLASPPTRLFAATVPASLGPGAAAAIGRTVATAAQQAATAGPGSPGAPPRPGATAGPGSAAGARPGATAGLVGAGNFSGPSSPGLAGEGPHQGRVGLVVMGDLSACRTERAPGAFRTEAAGFDTSVADAFRNAKPERLLDLDPAQAAELLVTGRVPLQVLAGAFEDAPAIRGHVLYEDAPYGVGYLVAVLAAP